MYPPMPNPPPLPGTRPLPGLRLPLGRRRLGPGATVSLVLHVGIIVLVVLHGRALLERAARGRGERGGGGGGGGGGWGGGRGELLHPAHARARGDRRPGRSPRHRLRPPNAAPDPRGPAPGRAPP